MFGVKVVGDRETRSALRAMERELPREVDRGTERGARPIARSAALGAPRDVGELASTVRAGRDSKGAFVSAGSERVRYAGIHERGGTINFPRRGATAFIRAQPYLGPAAERGESEVVEEVDRAIDRLAGRHGF